jgi:hypothetical protein
MITAPLTHAPKIAFALALAVVLAVSLIARSLFAAAEPGPVTGAGQQISPPLAQIHWDDRHAEVRDVAAGMMFEPDPLATVVVRQATDPGRLSVCVQPRSGLQVSTDGDWKQVVGGIWSTRPDPGAPYWCTRAPVGSDVEFDLVKAGGR